MGWAIGSSNLVGKVSTEACEDVLVAGPCRFAVIDGATDKTGLTYQWCGVAVSSGRFAAEVVAEVLRNHQPASPAELVVACTAALRRAVEGQHPGLSAELLPSASVVSFEVKDDTLWFVGDTQAAWVGSDGSVGLVSPRKEIDTVTAQFRAAVHAALEASGTPWDGKGSDPGREAILPLLRLQGALVNTAGPYGYSVLNGSPVPVEQIVVLDLSSASTVVLASDGYPSLAPEGRPCLAAAEEYLASALVRDPLCVSILCSTKGLQPGQVSFDDRAWLELRRN
jgi:hypothetical protein